MRVNDDYAQCNAEQQLSDPSSVFAFWQRILQLRRQYIDIFIYGAFEIVEHDSPSVICYRRICDSAVATIVLSFADDEQEWSVPPKVAVTLAKGKEVLSNYANASKIEGQKLSLKPFEIIVVIESKTKSHL